MTPNIQNERSSTATSPVVVADATRPDSRRWRVDPSSSMQLDGPRGRVAVQILGGSFVVAGDQSRAELRLDLAGPGCAAGPTRLELTSRSVERRPDGTLRSDMSGTVTVDGREIATDMVLRDCGVRDLFAGEPTSLTGTSASSPRRRQARASLSLDLLLIPINAATPAQRARAA
jgi:hypothetical protein